MSSFQQPTEKTYQGVYLPIILPETNPGKINVRATAEGMNEASVVIKLGKQ